MDFRKVIEDWRKGSGKSEAEMASILGLGELQQNYNDFKKGRKKVFPFEVALAFKKASGINLLDYTTDSRDTDKNPVVVNDIQIRLSDYINEIKDSRKYLQGLLSDKIGKIDSNLSIVSERQQVGDANHRAALEVLFGLHLGSVHEKTVEDLLKIVDIGTVVSLVKEKKKDIHSSAGK